MIPSRIVVVLGPHRSGTSVVAGLLHASGLAMGGPRTFIPRPSEQNPRGFFEDVRFRALNDLALAANGYRVKEWGTEIEPPRAPAGWSAAARALLRSRAWSQARFGWKDPRQNLTHHLWMAEIRRLGWEESLVIVRCRRADDAVGRSLLRRGDVADLDHGVAIAQLYRERADAAATASAAPVHDVVYEDLVADPVAIGVALGAAVGVLVDPGVASECVDPGLNRSAAP